MRSFWTLGVLAALALAGCGGGSSEAEEPAAPAGYRFVQVASGFESPVHVTAPRNQRGRLYVVEQEGRIRIVQNGRITGTLLDIRSQVQCCGEQGLLSVAFHPRYASNGKYYVNYTDRDGDTRVVEYRGKRRLRQLLFVGTTRTRTTTAARSRSGPTAGSTSAWATAAPAAIPRTGPRTCARRSASSSRSTSTDAERGRRSSATASATPGASRSTAETGDLYIGDVGQNSWEEVDFTRRRSPGLENYGWDVYEGRARFESKQPSGRGRLVFPVVVYPLGGGHCAVSGGFVYRGSAVPSAAGRYFYGDNCSGTVWSFPAGRARSVRREPFTLGGLSSFGEDAAGELYAVTLNGRLYQLRSS